MLPTQNGIHGKGIEAWGFSTCYAARQRDEYEVMSRNATNKLKWDDLRNLGRGTLAG